MYALLTEHPTGVVCQQVRSWSRKKDIGGYSAALHLEGRLLTPWVHTTDADVELPNVYLSRVSDAEGASAGYIRIVMCWKAILELACSSTSLISTITPWG